MEELPHAVPSYSDIMVSPVCVCVYVYLYVGMEELPHAVPSYSDIYGFARLCVGGCVCVYVGIEELSQGMPSYTDIMVSQLWTHTYTPQLIALENTIEVLLTARVKPEQYP